MRVWGAWTKRRHHHSFAFCQSFNARLSTWLTTQSHTAKYARSSESQPQCTWERYHEHDTNILHLSKWKFLWDRVPNAKNVNASLLFICAYKSLQTSRLVEEEKWQQTRTEKAQHSQGKLLEHIARSSI